MLGRRIRVEHWDTAIEQGKTAAHAHARRTTPSYDRLPYFFTDQYDLGMEYVGSVGPDGYDQVVCAATPARPGPRVHGVLAARRPGRWPAMHVNDWDATDHVRAHRRDRGSTPGGSRDTSLSLGDLAKG